MHQGFDADCLAVPWRAVKQQTCEKHMPISDRHNLAGWLHISFPWNAQIFVDILRIKEFMSDSCELMLHVLV